MLAVQSKFTKRIVFPLLTLFLSLGILAIITAMVIKAVPDGWTPFLVFYALFLFIAFWLVFGEMRVRMITVEINDDCLVIRGFLGRGKKKTLYFDELDGYETALLPSRYKTYEYLYLLQDGKRVARLSEFYHCNYEELKAPLHKNLKHLGSYGFRVGKELKDLFG